MKKTSCRDSMLNPIARMKSHGKRHNNTFIWSIDWCLIIKLVYTVNDEWKQHQFKDSVAPWKIKECLSRDRCNMCMLHCYKLNCRTSGNPVCCHHATCIYLYLQNKGHKFKLHVPRPSRHPFPLGISRLAGYSSKFQILKKIVDLNGGTAFYIAHWWHFIQFWEPWHLSQSIYLNIFINDIVIYVKKEERDIIWRSSQNDIIVCCFSAHLTSDIRYKNTFNRRITGKSKLATIERSQTPDTLTKDIE